LTHREDIKFLCKGFQEWWKNITAEAHVLDLDSPNVPRLRRIPWRLDSGGAQFSNTRMYRQQYFEVMDTASASLNCSVDLILLNSNTCN